MGDQEQHRHSKCDGTPHQRIGRHGEAGVFHDKHRFFSAHPCTHADADAVAFVGDLYIVDFGLPAQRFVEFFQRRIRQARREIDSRIDQRIEGFFAASGFIVLLDDWLRRDEAGEANAGRAIGRYFGPAKSLFPRFPRSVAPSETYFPDR